jgi:glycerol-3-phosphate dehydrogenase (NAD(P)+)
MPLSNTSTKPLTAVVGAGSFGTAVANLLAENGPVFLHSSRKEAVDAMMVTRENAGQLLHENITPMHGFEELCTKCTLIFPSVTSDVFRETMRTMSPWLRPDHILIHCTKGFDIRLEEGQNLLDKNLRLSPRDIFTMSDVILQETLVKRVGSLSGPNLARELADKQPAATVVASQFDEVIREGQFALRSKRFQVYGSNDIRGVELGGVLKNTMAIAAGALGGLGYGQNAMSFLISRGLSEIVRLGRALGAEPEAFLGLAGIGDLVATCTSPLSRNYTVGYRLAKGEKLADIMMNKLEVAEGVKTVNVCKKLADKLDVRLPIIQVVYQALYEDLKVDEGIAFLMEYRWGTDVDFM